MVLQLARVCARVRMSYEYYENNCIMKFVINTRKPQFNLSIISEYLVTITRYYRYLLF